MKNSNTRHGFTLIELLIVVIIIGILAAIALPQYQIAVDKSRLVPYIHLLKQIQSAQEVYYLEHGEYALNPNQLGIDTVSLCPAKSGSNYNMLFRCKGGGYINQVRYDDLGPRSIYFTYCPRYSTNVKVADRTDCDHNQELTLSFFFRYGPDYRGKDWTCVGHTTRGERICTVLKQ